MKKILYILILNAVAYNCMSQTNQEIRLYEDSILHYFNKILNYKTSSNTYYYSNQTIKVTNKQVVTADSEKLSYSDKISGLFNKVLNIKGSFSYPFSKLKNVSNLKSSDSLVRVITWNIPLQNGTYKYFGFVQTVDKKKDKIMVFKLTDKSDTVKKPEFAGLKPQKWYGALYYKMLTNSYNGKTYYTLLAWDGNNGFTNKKLIECFSINKRRLTFDEEIFVMKQATQNRIVFEYAKSVGMMLRYDKDLKMIVFDHLAPENVKFTGQYMYYGPDMSHDGIKFINGKWVLQENLNLQNKDKVKVKKMPKSY